MRHLCWQDGTVDFHRHCAIGWYFPKPSSPWTCAAVTRGLTSGSASPWAIIGNLSRSSTPRIVSRFCVACATGTFPQTVVIAAICNSGERIARKIANASSTPGSVSIRIRFIFCLSIGWVVMFHIFFTDFTITNRRGQKKVGND